MKTIDKKALYKEAREILARTRYLLNEATSDILRMLALKKRRPPEPGHLS